jgi:hypothetical protein
VFLVQASQTSQYVVPHGGIFLSKWHSAFVGSSDGKMNVQSACALNTRYIHVCIDISVFGFPRGFMGSFNSFLCN